MNDKVTQQLAATAERLANATGALERVLEKLDAQQEALNAKVNRIVAAVEEEYSETGVETSGEETRKLLERMSALEKTNEDLKAQAARMARKTLPPFVSALLSKTGSEFGEKLDAAALDKTMQSLSVEQRIAVKAEMARAGMIG